MKTLGIIAATGAAVLGLVIGRAPAQSPNNACINAVPLALNVPVTGNNWSDTPDGPTNTSLVNGCSSTLFAANNRTVWYTFVPPATGQYQFTMCASSFDTLLAIYPAQSVATGAVAPCSGSIAALACNDDSCGLRSNFAVRLDAGQGYIVRVSGLGGNAGNFSLLVHGPLGGATAPNDDCAAPTPLGHNTPTAGSLTGATGASVAGAGCGSTGVTGNDVWFLLAPALSGTAVVEVCANFDSIVGVYQSACAPLTPVSGGCNDDTIPAGCGQHGSRSMVTVSAGQTYLVRVAGVQHASVSTPPGEIGPAFGPFVVTAFLPQPTGSCCVGPCCTVRPQETCTSGTWTPAGTCGPGACPAVINDQCQQAVDLTLGSAHIAGNCGATLSAGEPVPLCQGNFGASVWFRFIPPVRGYYRISTCGGHLDSVLDVYRSPDCLVFSPVACDDDTCDGGEPGINGAPGSSLASVVRSLLLEPGEPYLVRISGFFGGTDAFVITVAADTQTGACCSSSTGACSISTSGPAGCPGGVFVGGVCEPGLCAQPPGACCRADGSCQLTSPKTCDAASGSALFQGTGTVCTTTSSCPGPAGACCDVLSGACSYRAGAVACSAAAGVYQGDGSVCQPSPCIAAGACCDDDSGACTLVVPASCDGVFNPGMACAPGVCPEPAGACCRGSTCAIETSMMCVGAGAAFAGAGSACNAPGDAVHPCCLADHNQSGGLGVQDIFDFLAAYFSGSASADINGGGLGVQDIFDFLAAYFSGCA